MTCITWLPEWPAAAARCCHRWPQPRSLPPSIVGWPYKKTRSLSHVLQRESFTPGLIRFKWLPGSFEIVLQVEKWPLPEVRPHFSFWTFGHLSSLCGAPRLPPLSCGEAPTTTEENVLKTKSHVSKCMNSKCIGGNNTHVGILAFIFESVQTCSVLRHV